MLFIFQIYLFFRPKRKHIVFVYWKTRKRTTDLLHVEDEEIPFSQRTEQKLKKPSCKILHKILQNLMVRCAGSKAQQ